MSHTNEHLLEERILNKFLLDILRLQSFVSIHTMEIELDATSDLINLVDYCDQRSFLTHSTESIFVDFLGIEKFQVTNVLYEIFSLVGDVISGIMLQVAFESKIGVIKAAIEIDEESSSPTLISVSNPAYFYEIMNYIRHKWFS